MADNLEIRLDIRTLQQAVQQLSQAAGQVDRIDRSAGRLVGGPNQRLMMAQASLARAQSMGNAPAAADARIAIARSQQQIQRQNRGAQTFIDRLQEAGAGLSRLGLAAGAVAGGVAMIADLVNRGTAAFEARGILGGSARDFGRLQGFGGAAGVGTGDLPALAAAFRERTGGGRAAGTCGFAPSREVDPGFDETRHLMRGIERLLNAPNDQRAREMTRLAPELEPFLKLRQASPQIRDAVLRQMQYNEAMADGGRRAMDAAIRMNQMSASWERFGQALVTSPLIDAAIESVSQMLDRLANLASNPLKSLWEDFLRPAHWGGNQGAKGGGSAQQQQTEATERNTAALEAMRKDWLNGGPRAHGAMPSRLRGQALDRAIENGLKDLGATTF